MASSRSGTLTGWLATATIEWVARDDKRGLDKGHPGHWQRMQSSHSLVRSTPRMEWGMLRLMHRSVDRY